MEVSVPQASIRLKQAVGRLLRSENDWGQVSILDRRLVDNRYGAVLLRSLPPMKLVVE
jgi:ATP-dependent DNA helicase DinG